MQTQTTGSVSGGDIINPAQQQPQVTLTRIPAGANLQTNTPFSLFATYTVGGVPEQGVQITGVCPVQLQGWACGQVPASCSNWRQKMGYLLAHDGPTISWHRCL